MGNRIFGPRAVEKRGSLRRKYCAYRFSQTHGSSVAVQFLSQIRTPHVELLHDNGPRNSYRMPSLPTYLLKGNAGRRPVMGFDG